MERWGYYQIGFNYGFLGMARKLPDNLTDQQQYRKGYQDGVAKARRKQPLVKMLHAVLKGNRTLEV